MGPVFALLSSFFFALLNQFIRYAGPGVGAIAGMLIMLVSEIGVGLGVLAVLGVASPPTSAGILYFLLAGVLTGFGVNLLLVLCVLNAGPAYGSTTKVAAGVLGVAIGTLFLGDRLAALQWVGVALVLGGLWTIARPRETPGADVRRVRLGLLYGLGAGLCVAVGNAVRQTALSHWPDSLAGSVLEATAGLVLVLLLPQVYREIRAARGRWRDGLPYVGAGIATLLGIIMTLLALQRTSVTIVNVLAGVEPVITLLLSALLVQNGWQAVRAHTPGVVIATIGVLLIVWA